jgi:hypothetical protein
MPYDVTVTITGTFKNRNNAEQVCDSIEQKAEASTAKLNCTYIIKKVQ